MKLIHGDCLEELKKLQENSIDAIVTDPPYGLSFMGKKWDYDVPSKEIWAECLRVLKPGGYLLSFAGTRTQHKIASGIEDAGFEIRDMIAWVYGSGFPKSLNIGKAVDKTGGKSVAWFGKWLREWREKEGINQKEISKLFPSKTGGLTGCVANWELGLNMPTNEQFNLICKTFGLPFENLEAAERAVLGTHNFGASSIYGSEIYNKRENGKTTEITKGTSEWEGWGTALKPALEPITVARKPIEGTVAENCLKWGVGGINIDECRVGTSDKLQVLHNETGEKDLMGNMKGKDATGRKIEFVESGLGRFPANLIHDGSDEVVELFPNTKSTQRKNGKDYQLASKNINIGGGFKNHEYTDNGSASRFFYCAKASKSERNMGCDSIPIKDPDHRTDTAKGSYVDKGIAPQSNCHPTVKPVAIMEYLVRLVSREGSTILDPFMGSGTTGIACKKLKRNFIGIEKEAEYIKIAESRISAQPITLL